MGGRGFHYTIGIHGTRTTVGLPCTGLSYTSTCSAGSTSTHPPHIDTDKALKREAKQQETFHLEVLDKEPGKESANR